MQEGIIPYGRLQIWRRSDPYNYNRSNADNEIVFYSMRMAAFNSVGFQVHIQNDLCINIYFSLQARSVLLSIYIKQYWTYVAASEYHALLAVEI